MSKDKTEHEHGCGDDCGCGDNEGVQMMKLELEDGTEVEWYVLQIFDVGDREYIALAPEEEQDVYIYRYSEDEDGVELGSIEDDEEFEQVGKVLEEILEQEFETEEEN